MHASNHQPAESISVIGHIVRGCGTLPKCGHHPGTRFFLAIVLMGADAGARKEGWIGALFGAGVMLVVFCPLYLYGAYSRSKTEACVIKANTGKTTAENPKDSRIP